MTENTSLEGTIGVMVVLHQRYRTRRKGRATFFIECDAFSGLEGLVGRSLEGWVAAVDDTRV